MLRKAIEDTLDIILIKIKDGKMKEEEVLSTIHKAVYYNSWHTGYIWELFFIQALKREMVPENPLFVFQLFRDGDRESFIDDEQVSEGFNGISFKGTRLKVLEHLKLDETIIAYKKWLFGQGTLEDVQKSFGKK